MPPVLRNAARDRLAAGELALGVGIRQSRTVDIASIMKACGYDWLFLDLEHNSMDLDTAVQISVAALAVGIAPIARVPAGQHWLATRILDGGGLGIVMPHVDTVEEARRSPIGSVIRRAATVRLPADCRISPMRRSALPRQPKPSMPQPWLLSCLKPRAQSKMLRISLRCQALTRC